ncbi:hypothetical protein ANAEL_02456 [Anaerolineales bacterium]|nr:hypothetical protein ANAEL_02456 [Anaerolineales bacterium]
MLETNIRIVSPGNNLFLWTRKAVVSGSLLSVDILEKACNKLRRKYCIAAIRYPGEQNILLVATKTPIQKLHLEDIDWELDVVDSGDEAFQVRFSTPFGYQVLPQLIERAILSSIAQRNDFWTIDSPRIFYEKMPFIEKDNISAFRRYEISALAVEGVGVGLAVDVGTAFFTTNNMDYFIEHNIDETEQKRRKAEFERITGRQFGQKGTLLYDTGRSKVKCYYEKTILGETCSTTGAIKISNKRYDSVYEYYKETNPSLPVSEYTPVVRVSFPGLDKGLPVAATRVKIRVMNDDVPESLNSIDKISPSDRRNLLEQFWKKVEKNSLNGIAPGINPGYWRPNGDYASQFMIPELIFGDDKILSSPKDYSPESYKNNFRQRSKYLSQFRCYSVPPTMSRTIYCAYPTYVGEEISKCFAVNLVEQIRRWTNINVTTEIIPYSNVGDATDKLRGIDNAGVSVFILDDEPVTYYDASYMLPGWRIKRITDNTVQAQYSYLTKGKWDRKTRTYNLERGKKQWDSFIEMNALALLYLLDVVPFKANNLGKYDAHLAIDVGHDRRFSAMSLTIMRDTNDQPSFLSRSEVNDKPDTQHEMINPVLLEDQTVKLFENITRRNYSPLKSLLILRDGQMFEKEFNGLMKAIERLKIQGAITQDAKVDLVDVHKDSLKAVRLWDISSDGTINNPLEGTVVRLNKEFAVITTTGAATLHQGTADPILIRSNGHCTSLEDAAESVFVGAQLNWFSLGVAQKLPLALKITDDELTARYAQEIRRVR